MSDAHLPTDVDARQLEEITDAGYYRIPLELIEPNPYQPRKFFDKEALQSLSDSIVKYGQLEDILVRPHNGKFQIVLGERRFRACQLARLPTIQAKVRPLSDEETFAISLTENVQRQDLTGVEEAFAFKKYLDEGRTQDEVANLLGSLDRRVGEKLKLLSSSYYVRYLEKQLEQTQEELDRIKQEQRLLGLDGAGSRRIRARIVSESELVDALENGWDIAAPLGNGKFALKAIVE
jgi:ParB/RepB/Spo0J family partition protein